MQFGFLTFMVLGRPERLFICGLGCQPIKRRMVFDRRARNAGREDATSFHARIALATGRGVTPTATNQAATKRRRLSEAFASRLAAAPAMARRNRESAWTGW